MGITTVAKVAVENTAYSFDMLFDYSVPSSLINDIEAGKRVLVPFGNTSKKRVGIVFSVVTNQEIDKKLKSISCVLDEEPLLTREMLLTSNFIHDKCFCTYFDSCRMFLPLGMSMDVKVLYASNNEYKTDNKENLQVLSIYDVEEISPQDY
jgi:primosomal protein N' (replication factor Y)